MNLQLLGIDKLLATIHQKTRQLPDKAGMALKEVGEVWMTEAKKRTPADTGTLRTSGHVQGPDNRGMETEVRLVFGGPAAPYAAVVHENLTAHHPSGQAKYLESVVLERKNTLAAEVAKRMK